MTVTMEMTIATIGRLIKNLEIMDNSLTERGEGLAVGVQVRAKCARADAATAPRRQRRPYPPRTESG
jgi:hypothetical protein